MDKNISDIKKLGERAVLQSRTAHRAYAVFILLCGALLVYELFKEGLKTIAEDILAVLMIVSGTAAVALFAFSYQHLKKTASLVAKYIGQRDTGFLKESLKGAAPAFTIAESMEDDADVGDQVLTTNEGTEKGKSQESLPLKEYFEQKFFSPDSAKSGEEPFKLMTGFILAQLVSDNERTLFENEALRIFYSQLLRYRFLYPMQHPLPANARKKFLKGYETRSSHRDETRAEQRQAVRRLVLQILMGTVIAISAIWILDLPRVLPDRYQLPLSRLEYRMGFHHSALALLRNLAAGENSEAQFELGLRYLNGLDVEQDYVEAAYWFFRIAWNGGDGIEDRTARHRLAELHLLGTGTDQDEAAAAKWLYQSVYYSKGADRAAQSELEGLLKKGVHGIRGRRILSAKNELRWTGSFGLDYPEGLKTFLAKGGYVNARNVDGSTPLFSAVSAGDATFARMLISKGANVLCMNYEGFTSLSLASMRGNGELVQLLLDAGADANKQGRYGITPLMWAADRGYVDSVRRLADHGADVNLTDRHGRTALFFAAGKGHVEIMEFLISRGADVNLKDRLGRTALRVADQYGQKETVRLLRNAGAEE